MPRRQITRPAMFTVLYVSPFTTAARYNVTISYKITKNKVVNWTVLQKSRRGGHVSDLYQAFLFL